MTWHVEESVWDAYTSGRLDTAAEASVETHVVGCVECRAAARSLVVPAAVDAVWDEVRTTIARPTLPLPLRVLRRFGVRGDDLVIVSAADSLLLPAAVAIGFAIMCGCLAGLADLGPASREAVFLALAPLVPVLAVVASYDALDPLRELAEPTPYNKLRMALLRATAALAVAVPATMAIGLIVPNMHDLAFMWLAPSLGLTVGSLVLLTWLEAWATGGLVATAWLGCVFTLRGGDKVDVLVTPLVQTAFVVVALALTATLVLRTTTLRLQGGSL